jgi:branched-chain amino acid transport system ATP-binding protein
VGLGADEGAPRALLGASGEEVRLIAQPEGIVSTQAPILATRDLGLDIGGARIVADVSLEVRAGELVGIIGPNGAGKTTLFNLLSGTIRPTAGRVELDGKDVTRDPPHRRTQAGLGRSFQVSSVFPLLSVGENVRLAAEARLGGTLNLARRAARYRPALERAGEALDKVGLASRVAWPAGMLSHGDKRKLEIAMLLAGDPRVILLDEPMAGVSVEDVDGLVEVIRSVHADEGRTVLMVEHRMEVVVGLAERIAVMHHGSVLAFDTPDRVMADETVQTAYLGEPL